MEKAKSHFILVHGGCHGAWCWYKLATMLRSAGYRVSIPDMAAAGIHSKQVEELKSISEYSQPLMDCLASLPSDEKVIMVGHSFGGVSISLAMEKYPDKIAVAVFVTAFMPGPDCNFTILLQQYYSRLDSQLDNQFFFHNGQNNPPTSFVFGNQFLASILYQNCTPEDVTLAKMLVRPMFLLGDADIIEDVVVSKERYGLVPRVYIISGEDKIIKQDFQEWMIEKNPTKDVKKIESADHMVMLSKPHELCTFLQEISETYS
ncbi:salicylic acid-binding protein 2-like [Thalictrum thalictroides]|uniref:Salicylic acid-binding protein 2-like n=1 Tax=Thalictrum thalictroides TaxID=46969 RepID=A0A7J6VH16_THATH|nr:salicylic acid-binding protein 2-like [Thalictrum thalictroides]